MSIKVPYGASLELLDAMRTGKLNGAFLGLFSSNYTPTNADVIATFTAIEPTAGGYARIATNAWAAAALNASNQAETRDSMRTFTFTGAGLPVTIYGIFLVSAGGTLLYAEKNPGGGVVISTAGQTFPYQPVFTDESKF